MNKTEISKLLEKYCTLPALSGYEKKMAEAMKSELEKYCDTVETDRLGNVIGTIKGTDESAPSIMLLAHMDNIGFMVKRILPSGLLQLERVGGSADKVLQGAAMVVCNEQGEYFEAAVGTQSYASNTMKDRVTVNPLAELTVDVGALSCEEIISMGINVGCPVMFRPYFLPMAANDRVIGSFMDDRAGCTAITAVAASLKEHRPQATVHIVGTVSEEFNLRGGVVAGRSLADEIAICIGAAISTDTPDTKRSGNTALGKGPVISMFNFHGRGTLNGCIPHKGLTELAAATAAANDISIQRQACRGILSETAYLQLEGKGVCCLDLNIPVRYTHSPSEVADLNDIAALAVLTDGMIRGITSDFCMDRYRV